MKIQRLMLIAGLLVAVAALASWLLVSHWEHSEQTFRILPKLAVAEQSYVHDHVSRGQPLPASLTLRDLVSSGYISADEIRSLGEADVTFYPTVTGADPAAILVRMRLPDGGQIAAFTDGSVAQLPYPSSK
jgi:hypothetical protein